MSARNIGVSDSTQQMSKDSFILDANESIGRLGLPINEESKIYMQ